MKPHEIAVLLLMCSPVFGLMYLLLESLVNSIRERKRA